MSKKGSNPPAPNVSLRPPPPPSPPSKENVDIIEVRHIYNTKELKLIPVVYMDLLENKLQLILDKVIEIEKTVNGGK